MLAESGRLGKQLMRKSSKTAQAKAQEKTIRVLSERSVRLQTIEHRMEVLHMQPPLVTKKMSEAGAASVKKAAINEICDPSKGSCSNRQRHIGNI